MIKYIFVLSLILLLLAIIVWVLGATGFTLHPQILFSLRLPRILMAVMAGAVLGLSGAAIQGFLRNPLAEPALLGVSSWSALGSIYVLYFLPFAFTKIIWMPVGGIIGALFSVILLFILSGRQSSIFIIVLAGIVSSNLAAALIALMLNLAPNPWVMGDMMGWLFGSLSRSNMAQFLSALPMILLGMGLIFSCHKGLDALSLGEEVAHSFGVNLSWLYIRLAVGIAICVGVITSFCGAIGFIGLIVPHILRPFANHMPSRLLVLSMFGGAILLLLADFFVQRLSVRSELYVGVVSAFIGVPFFLHLLWKQRQRGWR